MSQELERGDNDLSLNDGSNQSVILTESDLELIKDAKVELKELREIKQILVQKQEAFSGPLPHPDHFARYNKIVPGSGNRLISMVEKDLAHHQHVQKLYGYTDAISSIGGLLVGGVVSLVALVGSGYLVMNGHDVAGAFLGTSTLASLVSIFVYGTRHKDINLEKK